MSLVADLYVALPMGAGLLMSALAVVVRGRRGSVRGVDWFLLALYLGVGSTVAGVAHLFLDGSPLQPLAASLAAKFAVWSVLATAVFVSAYVARPLTAHPVGKPLVRTVLLGTFVPAWIPPYQGMLHTGWVPRAEPVVHVSTVPTAGGVVLGVGVAAVVVAGLGLLVGRLPASPRRLGLAAVGLAALPVAAGLTGLGVVALDWLPATSVGLAGSSGSVFLGLVRSPPVVAGKGHHETPGPSDSPVITDGGEPP